MSPEDLDRMEQALSLELRAALSAAYQNKRWWQSGFALIRPSRHDAGNALDNVIMRQ
jgi:hypothetical protein